MVDTLLQAWASHAFQERIDGQEDPPPPPSGSGEGFGAPKKAKKRAKEDFRGIKLSNETHHSSTDPEALLARKSNAHPAQLSYRGHVLMENRHDLAVDCQVTLAVAAGFRGAVGYGERDAAQEMAADCPGARQKTIGADTNYDTKGVVAEMRRLGVTPNVPQNTARSGGSAIDAMAAPPGMRATPNRSMPAAASRRCLAGSNSSAASASSSCGGGTTSAPYNPTEEL